MDEAAATPGLPHAAILARMEHVMFGRHDIAGGWLLAGRFRADCAGHEDAATTQLGNPMAHRSLPPAWGPCAALGQGDPELRG
jgi:hypothetical protein